MLMFVMVSIVAAQADWSLPVAGVVLALIAVRGVAKVAGIALANPGSGASWKQAFWVGCAMAPLSSIAMLIASNFVTASPLLGALIATVAVHAAGESSIPWMPEAFTGIEETQR